MTLRRFLLLAGVLGVTGGAVAAVVIPSTEDEPRVTAGAAVTPGTIAPVPPPAQRRRPRLGPPLRESGFDVELRAERGSVRLGPEVRDPLGGPPWVVRSFRGVRVTKPEARREGVDPVLGRVVCAQLGRRYRGRFGWVDAANVFRPVALGYSPSPLTCAGRRADLGGHPMARFETRITDVRRGDPQVWQTVAWGLTGRGAREVAVAVAGRPRAAPLGPHGTFVVPLAPSVRAAQVRAVVRYPGRAAVQRRLGRYGRGPYFVGAGRMERAAVKGAPRVEARTPDPDGGVPWGLSAIRAARGGWCTGTPGRVVGDRVGGVALRTGLMSEGVGDEFRCPSPRAPLTRERPLDLGTTFGGVFPDEPADGTDRTLRRTLRGRSTIHGRAHPDVASITIATPRDVRTIAPSGRARAFLVVYDGTFPTGATVVTVRFRDGTTRREVLPETGF